MRHILSIIIGFFVSVGLFMIMNAMITNPSKKMLSKESVSRSVYLSAKTPNISTPKKQVKTIKPMPKEHKKVEIKLKPVTQKIDIQNPTIAPSNIQIAINPIKLDKLPDVMSEVAPTPNTKAVENVAPNLHNEKVLIKEPVYESIDSTLAIKKAEPRYPRRAKKRGITGYVTCEFKINQNGEVYDVKITKSRPNGTFDKAALKAIKQWKFNKFTNRKYKVSSATFNFEVE